jgi:hypothetical protein
MEQGANIKLRFSTGQRATETSQLIKQAYADNALSHMQVLEWYARFSDHCENLEDEECSGRPTAVSTSNMIETVQVLI